MSANETNGVEVSREPGREWLTPWRFAAVLALLVLVSFPRVITGLQTFGYLDYGQFAYPVAFHYHHAFWRGELPFWNPLSSCGLPFLAQWNTQTLYPLSVFYLLLPMPWSLGVYCLMHLVLAGAGMYWLSVRWTGSALAAAVAGTVFAFNGFMWYAIVWPHILCAMAWMPWVILTMERAWSEGGRRLITGSFAAALQLLSGGAEVILLTWFFLGGLFCLRLFERRSPWSRMILRAALAGGLAGALAAPQWLPFLDLLAHSQRGANYGSAEMGVMPLFGWANYLVPVFHCLKNPQGLYVPPNHWTGSYYLGGGVIALAIIGVIRARSKVTGLLLGFILFSLLMALGGPGKVHSWVAAVVPLLGFLRFPIKFVILATFLIPLLAAFGLAWWQRHSTTKPQAEKKLLAIVSALLVGSMGLIVFWSHAFPLNATDFAVTAKNVAGRVTFLVLMVVCLIRLQRSTPEAGRSSTLLRGAGLQLALLVMLWADVLTHNSNLSPAISPATLEPDSIRRYFGWNAQVGPGASRVMQSPASYQRMLSVGCTDLDLDTLGRRLGQFFNYNLLDSVPKVDGFYSLYPKEHHTMFERLYFGTNQAGPLQDFLGVSFVTHPTNAVGWIPRPSFMPFVTAGQRVEFLDDASALDAILSERFEPSKTVYLPLEAENRIRARAAVGNVRTAVTDYSAGRVVVEVEAESPSMVVVSQTYYHRWRALLNDRPVPVWRANYCFQAVEVPAGKSRVTVFYRDDAFRLGLAVCFVAMLAALWIWFRFGKSRQTPATDTVT